jgi:hypothetical protein
MLLEIFIYTVLWLSFGALHSILAADGVRRIVARVVGKFERLVYNIIATVHLTVTVYVGHLLLWKHGMFPLPVGVHAALAIVAIIGGIGMLLSLMRYDVGVMTGWSTIAKDQQAPIETATQPLATDGFHRHTLHSHRLDLRRAQTCACVWQRVPALSCARARTRAAPIPAGGRHARSSEVTTSRCFCFGADYFLIFCFEQRFHVT